MNKIDKLNSVEIAGGDKLLEEDDDNASVISHDGVELSIQGSDIDEDEVSDHDEDNQESDDGAEPGEIESSDEDDYSNHVSEVRRLVEKNRESTRKRVASKVVLPSKNVSRSRHDKHDKPSKHDKRDKFAKYSHLRKDPEFNQFLDEMLDDKIAARDHSAKKRDRNHQSKTKQKGTVNSPQPPTFKSLSDTTIYSPGLRKATDNDILLIEKISNFIESIRLDGKKVDDKVIKDTPTNLITGNSDVRRVEHSEQR